MTFNFSLIIWLMLGFSIILVFAKKNKPAQLILLVTLLLAFFEQRLSFISISYLSAGFLLAFYTPKLKHNLRYGAYFLLSIWSLLLFMHKVPGFDNLQVLNQVNTSSIASPFSMYLNLDKPLSFFVLLVAYPALLGKEKKIAWANLTATLIILFSLLPIAVLIGALKIDLTLPSWLGLFIFNNLLLTSVSEEALFRGFIQQGLTKKYGAIFAVATASALFGVAHFAGGALFMLFGALAGLGYGLVFYLTGRLWAAVVVHFAFNLAHLLFFTYPLLK